jgi:hypothetical protein
VRAHAGVHRLLSQPPGEGTKNLSQRTGRGKQDDLDFERSRGRCPLKGFYPLLAGVFGIEQGFNLDESSLKETQGWFERSTAGAHHGDLVDDDRGRGDLLGAVKRRFQHQRAARPHQGAPEGEPTGLAAAIDDDIEATITLRRSVQRGDPAPPEYGQFAGMTTDDAQLAARQLPDLRHEQAELTVADDRHTLTRPDVEAVGDLDGRRERFDEHGLRITYRMRHAMEIPRRERQKFGHGTVALVNLQDRALGTVHHISPSTGVASAIVGIDFADDTAAIG